VPPTPEGKFCTHLVKRESEGALTFDSCLELERATLNMLAQQEAEDSQGAKYCDITVVDLNNREIPIKVSAHPCQQGRPGTRPAALAHPEPQKSMGRACRSRPRLLLFLII